MLWPFAERFSSDATGATRTAARRLATAPYSVCGEAYKSSKPKSGRSTCKGDVTVTVGTIDCTMTVLCCAPCWTLGRVAAPFWTRLLPGAVAGTGRAHQSAPDHHGQAERRIKPDQIHVANVENVKMIRNLHSLLSNSFLILSASLCCTLTSGFVAVIEVHRIFRHPSTRESDGSARLCCI